jgi:hypothetical protein
LNLDIVSIKIILVLVVFAYGVLLLLTYNAYYYNQSYFAYAHFFGKSKYIDNYQIVFQPFPLVLEANENSTLNFNILDKDNANINNVYAALTVREKNTAKVVAQIPYKFYEFSDITFPYRFRNSTDYTATFEAKINGDPKYHDNPLVSNFDVSVGKNNGFKIAMRFDQLILYYVTPATVAIAGIIMYILSKNK